jgi:hypothetical protein
LNGFERVGDIPIPDELIVSSYAAPNEKSEAEKEVSSSVVKTAVKEFLAKRLGDTASANRNRSEIPNLHHHALRSAPIALSGAYSRKQTHSSLNQPGPMGSSLSKCTTSFFAE